MTAQMIIQYIQQRTLSITLLISMLINTVLLSAFLYVVLPKYSPSFNNADMLLKVTQIAKTIDADVVNVWKFNLNENKREHSSTYVKDETDAEKIKEFISLAQTEPFSNSITAQATVALINGAVLCEGALDILKVSNNIKTFRENFGIKHMCWMPITSMHNELIGYIAFIWKTEQNALSLQEKLSRTLSNINKK